MKKKIDINQLKVQSFVTNVVEENTDTVKAKGGCPATNNGQGCPTFPPLCSDIFSPCYLDLDPI